MDVLLGARKVVLDRAQKDLSGVCSSIHAPDEAAHCWEAYQYLDKKRREAEEGCARELQAGPDGSDGAPGRQCGALADLERLIWELEYSGGTKSMIQVLRTQARFANRTAAQSSGHATTIPASELLPHNTSERPEDADVARIAKLFDQVDTDGNGRIDREELRSAMDSLHHHLDAQELGHVFNALQANGFVTKEEFMQIVQAEALSQPGSDAQFLRHLHHDKPKWWSAMPASLDMMD